MGFAAAQGGRSTYDRLLVRCDAASVVHETAYRRKRGHVDKPFVRELEIADDFERKKRHGHERKGKRVRSGNGPVSAAQVA